MPKGELPSRSEQEADECLHCAVIDMVDERIAAGGADAADLAARIAESLVVAHTLSALGDLFLQKSGAEGGGSVSTH